jgi:hypothetical protein
MSKGVLHKAVVNTDDRTHLHGEGDVDQCIPYLTSATSHGEGETMTSDGIQAHKVWMTTLLL